MNEIIVHQALYGYADGHRLLASSRPISGQSGRLLRSVSDMAFEGSSSTYLTVLPVPELKAHAFIRTWPASEDLRPGSVWSHVLLLDFVDLGHMDSFGPLLEKLERPPTNVGSDQQWKTRYSSPLSLKATTHGAASVPPGDLRLAKKLLAAAYSRDVPRSVVSDSPQMAEAVLIAIFEQQWPRLRRSFAFRTRARSSASLVERFDIEVVERSKAPSSPTSDGQSWVDILADDLVRPDPMFRLLLRTFGPESSGGNEDVPGLVRVLARVRVGDASKALIDDLCLAYPGPAEMRGLKRALCATPEASPSAVRAWLSDDVSRLSLLLQAGGSCLDFVDLDVASRLRTMWRARPDAAASAVAGTSNSRLTKLQLDLVVSTTAAEARGPHLAELLEARSDLGLLMLKQNVSLASEPGLWEIASFRPHLIDVLRKRGRKVQVDALIALVLAQASVPVASVLRMDPTMWWDAFFVIARSASAVLGVDRVQYGSVLRSSLAKFGAAAIGKPPHALQRGEELVFVTVASDLTAGLWRYGDVEAWLEFAEHPDYPPSQSKLASARVGVVVLALAAESRSRSIRRRAWMSCLAGVHRALLTRELHHDAWEVLREVLPGESSQDRSVWLRRAAIETMHRDRWPRDAVEQLAQSLPEHSDELVADLKERKAKRKKTGFWMLDVLDELRRQARG